MIIKNILITGASSGIGEALALYYAQQQETENLYICGRNQQRLSKVKKACQKTEGRKARVRSVLYELFTRHRQRYPRYKRGRSAVCQAMKKEL